MLNKNVTFLIFILCNTHTMSAQSLDSLKYQMVICALDSLFPKLDMDYINYDKPIEPYKYKNESDTIHLINPTTYEIDTMTSKQYNETMYIDNLQVYQMQIKRWENKEKLNKKVILVQNLPKQQLKLLYVNETLENFKELIEFLALSDTMRWNMTQFSLRSDYLFDVYSSSNLSEYQYSYVAFMSLSDVIFDEKQTKAVFEMGIHYGINKKKKEGWVTGYSYLICLEKRGSIWKVTRTRMLAEE